MYAYSPSAAGTALAAAPASTRKGTVLATVLGCNALAMAALVTWAAVTARTADPNDGEDWTGVVILIVVAAATVAILLSTVIGITVALVRAARPGASAQTPTTGQAVRTGLRAAAWGLCAFTPIVVLMLI